MTSKLRTLPGNLVDAVMRKHQPGIDLSTKRSDFVGYYNSELTLKLGREQWDEFFFIYHTANELGHGTDAVSHVLAAHALVLAYGNMPRATALLRSLPPSPAVELSHLSLQLLVLDRPPNWKLLVKACVSAFKI